ncbi:MAG: calcium-binding protein, partial [Hyphomicrobiales bacterium]
VLGGSAGDTITAGTGIDVILGDNGVIKFSAPDIVESTVTTDPTYGGNDDIEAGLGADIVVGGVGSDRLKAGGDADVSQDIILGDEGELWFFPTGQLKTAFTVIPVLGNVVVTSDDIITTGGGDNVVLGGNGADSITAGSGADILFGDNGHLEFDLGGTLNPTALTERRLVLARTTDPLNGGVDSIYAGAGRDLVIGGTAGDYVEGGDGADTIFGDHGLYDIDLPAYQRAVSIFFRAEDGGGNDTLRGQGGEDFIVGQQGSDILKGGDGEDDIIGGHNVVGGADAGDTIEGNAEDDVILGDNGTILREIAANAGDFKTMDWVRVSYGAGLASSTMLRTVMRYDLSDGQGGNDKIYGQEGDDTIYGQLGNDQVFGDAGSDEIVGGLGNDEIHGGDGIDFVLGDEGTIYKALDVNGAAVRNTDGSWRRYIVTEEVATVTDRIAIDSNGHAVDSAFAGKLLTADMILLAGGYTDTGKQLATNGAWATSALLLDVTAGGNDTIYGEVGDDILIGQRGSDTIDGGDGNDTIFGDKATNIANMGTDLPLIVNAVRLIGATAAAGIYIPIGGTV